MPLPTHSDVITSVLENQYCFQNSNDPSKIITSDIEACVAIVIFGSEKTGVAHITPSIYKDSRSLEGFLSDFSKDFEKNADIHLVGGMRYLDGTDGQNVVKNALKNNAFSKISPHIMTTCVEQKETPKEYTTFWNMVITPDGKQISVNAIEKAKLHEHHNIKQNYGWQDRENIQSHSMTQVFKQSRQPYSSNFAR